MFGPLRDLPTIISTLDINNQVTSKRKEFSADSVSIKTPKIAKIAEIIVS